MKQSEFLEFIRPYTVRTITVYDKEAHLIRLLGNEGFASPPDYFCIFYRGNMYHDYNPLRPIIMTRCFKFHAIDEFNRFLSDQEIRLYDPPRIPG